jgi:3-oxoacyl-[acyl-carrier-protein] synthase II
MKRVVVTGVGLVTPLACGTEESWSGILSGKSGIKKIEDFDVSDLSAKIAGLVPKKESSFGFDPDLYISVKDQRKMDRFIQYAMAASHLAVFDSGWHPEKTEDLENTGVMIGAGIGGLPNIYETSRILDLNGSRRVSPFFIPSCLINLASGFVSIKFGFKGPNHSVVTACASGAHAIGDAARLIQCGDTKVMVAGGSEAAVCRIGVAGFASAKALSTAFNDDPERASRPWDKARDGFIMGEGAGIVILEELEHAKARGAKIYGEFLGCGMSGDAHHITAPAQDGDGAFRAMKKALEKAKLNPEDIDYINAHGTSTPLGDEIEVTAVKRLFKDHSYKLSMSSTKSSIGHLLGAAGGVEAIFSLLAIRDGIMPPTINLDDPSEGCDIDLIPHKPKEKKLNRVMSNSFGFGGTNISLLFEKYS